MSTSQESVQGIARNPAASAKAEVSASEFSTTSFVLTDESLEPYQVYPALTLFAARSLVAALGAGTERDQLLQLLQGVPRNDPDPLRVVRGLGLHELTPEAAAVVRLLANTHAPSFDSL